MNCSVVFVVFVRAGLGFNVFVRFCSWAIVCCCMLCLSVCLCVFV